MFRTRFAVNRRGLSVVGLVLAAMLLTGVAVTAQGPKPQGAQSALGSGFTYQGQLKKGGAAVNTTCDMQFSLWDAQANGTQVGSTQTIAGVPVTNGLFTALVNNAGQFGPNAFNGQERWLQVAVQCGSDSSFTALSRQRVSATPYASYAAGNWGLNGNAGTTASNFIGSSDNMSLTIAVSGTAALRIYPDVASPNLIGGSQYNTVTVGLSGVTIGGGGRNSNPNRASNSFATIGGGIANSASGYASSVGGGQINTASGYASSVSGGYNNTASGDTSSVGGGNSNTASGTWSAVGGGVHNTASDIYSTVSGGYSNTASVHFSAVGGGQSNSASGGYSAVGGGQYNTASGDYSSVSGGRSNNASGGYSTVGGGGVNKASGGWSTVSGGADNIASADFATASGGYSNTASGPGAFVGGGGFDGTNYLGNMASGNASTVGGGVFNTASAGYSTVGGGQFNTASNPYSPQQGGYSAVSGGYQNTASGLYSTIGGGLYNTAGGFGAFVGGGGGPEGYSGDGNTASGSFSTVSGGHHNTASAVYSTVSGGSLNTAGGTWSFAAGNQAKANHDGAFVWADSNSVDFNSGGTNQFDVRATGGISLVTSIDGFGRPTSRNVSLSAGSFSFGAATRQMLNLYAAAYGIGVQGYDMYFRSDAGAGFAWFEGGIHNDNHNDPGGGTRLMRLDEKGNLVISGTVTSGAGADLAERIIASDTPEPGDVVEIDPNHPGQFRTASTANSSAVAGVVSTHPGVRMNVKDDGSDEAGVQLALAGRVPVKVSAENGAIQPGDLLVASDTPGHAMRAPANPAPGTIIGKALGTLDDGTGLIEMLVMLR